MKKTVFVIFLSLSFAVQSQITKDAAIDILIQNVLEESWMEKEISMSDNAILPNTVINIHDSFLISPNHSSWFFFVDDYPLADWWHNCRYVFIDVIDGSVVSITMHAPPIEFSNMVQLNNINQPFINPVQSIFDTIHGTNIINTCSDGKYAVIISGGVSKKLNWPRYWKNCSAVYQTLVNVYHYDKNKIFIIMSDGMNPDDDFNFGTKKDPDYRSLPLDLDFDGINEYIFSATKTNISLVFDTLSTLLKPNDNIFIFVTDHGGENSTISLWNNQRLTKSEFQSEINKLNVAKVVNCCMIECYGGGYTSSLVRNNTIISTACSNSEYVWSRSRSRNLYGEFCYHWVSAVSGQTPDSNISVNADFNNDGHVSMEEAFQYARNNDAWANTPPTSEFHETPQYYSNKPCLGASMDLNGVFDHSCFGIDLYTRDNLMDNGIEPLRDTIDGISDSPDIWLRNYQDGITIHQTAIRGTNYLYVRIHNAGTDTSYSTDSIRLLYSPVFSTIHNFNPANWSELLVASLPRIAAGRDTILCFPIYFSLPTTVSEMNYVLYSRIESPFDPLRTSETNLYGNNVINNNNISLKKVIVTNHLLGLDNFGICANFTTNAISPDNPYSNFRLNFNVNDLNILNEAEVTIIFPEDLMTDWTPVSENIKQLTANTFLVTGEKVEFSGVPETDVTLRYNFLTTGNSPDNIFKNHITQYIGDDEELVGGLTIQIEKPERASNELFTANAGNDTAILLGTSATLHATQINENATYRWYDKQRNFKYEGLNCTITPSQTSEYILEVTAESDGYRDLDTVKVNVVPGCIRSITPNPVTDNWVTVSYEYASTVTSAHLLIYNTATTALVGDYDLSNLDNVSSLDIEVANYPTGSYTVVLACDNSVCHSKVLIRQ